MERFCSFPLRLIISGFSLNRSFVLILFIQYICFDQIRAASQIRAKSLFDRSDKGRDFTQSDKGGFPLFAETTRSELASTRWLAEQFPVIV